MRTPPPWMIDEMNRRRREQDGQSRQIWAELPPPPPPAADRSRSDRPREPIVIEF